MKYIDSIDTLKLKKNIHMINYKYNITSNDRSFSCTVIYTDNYSQCNLFIDTYNNAWYNLANWLIGMPYSSMIARNDIISD